MTDLLAQAVPEFVAHIPTPPFIYHEPSKLPGEPINAFLPRFWPVEKPAGFWYLLLLFFWALWEAGVRIVGGHSIIFELIFTVLTFFIQILPEVLYDTFQSS